ncbi:MAG: FkbM family methyltransferase [Acidobacteriia bacterium]|nr:FkbM family methyltransferase [Terriglobia bacterium]
MPALHQTIRRVSALIPDEWKRHLKTALFEAPDTEASLRRMRRLGFNPAVVIDVGAYIGEWTRSFKRIFPGARILMVEPQPGHSDRLRAVSAAFNGIELASVLLGAQERGNVPFHLCESASSVLMESAKPPGVSTISVPMTTLDKVTANTVFARPDFIKLDVQGYELEVLRGGTVALVSVEAVLMEVNLLGILDGAPLFHEATQFMSERGFQVYDICTFFRRPYDDALWQVDVIFVRKSSSLVASKRWA